MGRKYFISYSRSVKEDVGRLVDLLRAKGHDVWWDADISPAQPWWATIVDKIIWCEVFVFVTSEKSVASPYCMAELKYATERNRPILPFIIDDQTRYTIPPEVTPKLNQWLTYSGDMDDTSQQIILAVARLDRNRYQDIDAPRPSEPGKSHDSLIEQYQQAVTLAENGHFEEALKNFREIEALDAQTWGADCRQWIGKLTLYRQIVELSGHKGTLRQARTNWTTYNERYKDDDELFDPLGLGKKITTVKEKDDTPEPTPAIKAPVEIQEKPQLAASKQAITLPMAPLPAVPQLPIVYGNPWQFFSRSSNPINTRYVLIMSLPLIVVSIAAVPRDPRLLVYDKGLYLATALFLVISVVVVNIVSGIVLKALTTKPRLSNFHRVLFVLGGGVIVGLLTQLFFPLFLILVYNLGSDYLDANWVLMRAILGVGSACFISVVTRYYMSYLRHRIVRLFVFSYTMPAALAFMLYEWSHYFQSDPRYLFSPEKATSSIATWIWAELVIVSITLLITLPLTTPFLAKRETLV